MRDASLLTDAPPADSDTLRDGMEEWMEGYRRAMALRAAVRLSLFAHTPEPVSAEELAESTGWDPVMTRLLLDALSETGLLEEDSGTYRNSLQASLYLDPASERHLGVTMENIISRMDGWADLDRIVREGPGQRPPGMTGPEAWIRGIGESAAGGGIARTVRDVEESLDAPLDGTFMDLAGGHGLYAVAFKAVFPEIRVILFDKPEMAPVARGFFDSYGCEAEILTGDFYTDDLGGPYDTVFSSFNRSNSDIRMCRKVFESVAPGGLLIMRRHLDPGPASPLSILEWNLVLHDDAPKGEKRFHGSWMPSSDAYMETMSGFGMETLVRKKLDRGSELVVMRRIRRRSTYVFDVEHML